MNSEQLRRVGQDRGFIAALDQSGGSTPKALRLYGIADSSWSSEDEMFDLMHAMRSRMITSAAFGGDRILGAILFEMTMDREVGGIPTANYLWERKQVVPFLKIDKGLAEVDRQVQLMNPMPDLSGLLARARDKGIFGTKMRSVIHGADPVGIESVVAQQFSVAREILGSGLVPIIEPEIDITIADKPQAEAILLRALLSELSSIDPAAPVMLKLSLPDTDDLYQELTNHPSVLRVVALSGGYPREEANGRLAKNHGVIASFSRALTEGLSIEQTDEEFTLTLDAAIGAIFDASNT